MAQIFCLLHFSNLPNLTKFEMNVSEMVCPWETTLASRNRCFLITQAKATTRVKVKLTVHSIQNSHSSLTGERYFLLLTASQ